TFIVSDGLHSQTFRFIDPDLPFTADPTVIDVAFEEGLRADEMAALIVAAINSAADLDVTATSVYYSNAVGSNRVLLNGAAVVDGIDLLVYDEEGQFPTGVVVYDVNGDLIVDVAFTCDEYTGTVTDILSGVVYDVGNLPSAIAMADVNNDGTYDIVTSNAGDHTVSLLLGNSTGTYERQVTLAVGNEPSDVALYDLDADGNVDIVTANKTDGTVTILYGLGDGTFQSAVTLPVGWAPMGIAVGDLNGDGFSDIVAANSRDNTVSVLLGVTNVVYAAPVTYDVGRLPVDVKLGDMNKDGAPDILTANRVEGTVSLLLGDGFGGFADAVDYAAGTEPVALDVADLDLDENLDVVTVNYSINGGYILLGTGLSENTLSDSPIAIPTGTGPRGIALGDIDEDEMPDIFTADYLAHQSTVLLSTLAYAIPISLSLGNSHLRKIEGDPNEERVQGIVVIESNEILYPAGYGIEFDAGQRDGSPHPGSTAPLVKVNQQDLVPCVMIQNNLIVGAGTSGILFSGDTNQDGTTPIAPAAVPFGRIVNNTVYGSSAPVELLEPGDIVMGPNDDNSTELLAIGFALNFYGNTYTEMYVNNNGNITFDEPLWDFVPDGFPQNTPIIAPFWADVDTRATGEVRVAYGTSSNGNPVVQIDWIDVGYYSTHADKKNSFTLYIEDDPVGDIVMFVYHDMQWTSGDVDGMGGFGGEGAQIGFDAGDHSNYISVSRPRSLHDLEDLMDPGIYVWRLAADTGVPIASAGIGIEVTQNASPTILNNIVANLEIGISVDDTCSTTVIGANAYQNNGLNTLGINPSQTALFLDPDEPLFVDPDNGNFYPAAGSRVIDSSIDSLEDRSTLKQVRDPLGISPSPILAPNADIYGQLRADDINTQPPSGMGSNIFKDRGAIDRVDFVAPTATLIDPMDRDSVLDPPGVDRDLAPYDVFVVGEDLPVFSIQLSDTTDGIGIDDHSVTPSTVTIYKDGSSVPLVLDKDYYFRYDDATDVITLIAAPGLWKDASRYKIVLDNSAEGIRDIAGNALRPNRDGMTYFTVSIGYVDFGDAPDPDYPTTLDSDGARHLLIGNYYLGNGVSGEADARVAYDLETGELLKNASADTMDDGVSFTSSFLVGSTVTLDVKASASGGYLHAWIDLNGDGDFDDADEHVIASEPLAKGWNSLSFTLPTVSGYFPRETFMRFRYIGYDDTAAPIGPTGEVVGGEVEDYQVVLVDSLKDFGDAPNPYPTLLADNGAYHILGGSLFLGVTLADVDDELDGQPSATARGDDNHGLIDETGGAPVVINDENGVRFLDYIVPGTTVDVSVAASVGGGYLNAWIDFNADGDWDDAGEQIATGLLLAAGDNALSVAIPADAVVGKTFARFRLSTEQFLGVTGGAVDGEVEDYQILVTDSPRDYGDAPLSYFTKKDSQAAAAHLILAGQNNDMLITAVVLGEAMNDVNVVIVNELAYGDEAFVEYDADANELRIDVDPQFTTAATVVAAVNSQVGTIFTAVLSSMVDQGNDGSGLLPMKGMVA
ncbi:MAG: VCBS repeat-containing protein, partial [Pirellulales bacterium]|nr:VCBS repeat-containing protein [Pirellulales bacterium]